MASSEIRTQLKNLKYQQSYLEKELSKHGRDIDRLEKLSQDSASSSQTKDEVIINKTPAPISKKRVKVDPTQVKVKQRPMVNWTASPNASKPEASKPSVDYRSSDPSVASDPSISTASPSKSKVSEKASASWDPKKSIDNLRKRELDFGKVWFVRLGIISLITGLVFLSNFAYQNYIITWGAGPRIAALYLLASIMLGMSFYLEKAKEALSNYGRVLAAGGMATMYYTSYAAHHVERLKVIDSPLLGGVLLLTSAAACLGYALWRKSTTTAIFSIILAFYSTSINPVGGFTLISSFILTTTGLILLHKLRKVSIGFTTMLSAYLSFAYWQFFVNQGSGYEHASWFVLGYWILCTAVILLKKNLQSPFFNKNQTLIYTTLNNGFFIALSSINFTTQTYASNLWLNLASIGVTFLVISRYLYTRDKASGQDFSIITSLASLYLGKGFALIAVALCLKLSGPSLVISLAVQAILAIVSGARSQRKFHLTAGFVVLMLGFAYYLFVIQQVNTIHHAFLFILYTAIAIFLHLKAEPTWIRDCIPFTSFMSMVVLFALITTASISVFTQVIIFFLLFIAIRSLKGTKFFKFLPTSLYHLSHALPIAGILGTLIGVIIGSFEQQHCLLILILTLLTAGVQIVSVLHWNHLENRLNFTAFYNICFTLMLFIYLAMSSSLDVIMVVFSIVPIVYHFLYSKVRVTSIPVIGMLCYTIPWLAILIHYQGFELTKISEITIILCSLTPLAHHYLIKLKHLISFDKIAKPPLQLSVSLALIAAAIGFISLWQIHMVPYWEVSLALTAMLFYYLEDKQVHHAYSVSALFMYICAAVSVLFIQQEHIMRYIVISIPLIAYTLNRYQSDRVEAQLINRCIAIFFSVALWFAASAHTVEFIGFSARSICWALIGLMTLTIGFLAKDITFRSVAFVILGCTILHVYGVDVWKLNALLRVLSFITLGVVLLLIGYLYCRKVDEQEEIDNE